MNLGEKIDKLLALRDSKAELNEQIKKINELFKTMQIEVITHMEKEDVRAAKGVMASASITIGFYPGVKDLEAFAKWVVKNNKYEMMQKRVAPAAIKEMYDSTNKLPPGVESHTEPKLNLRRT